jgi:hypothetical protein
MLHEVRVDGQLLGHVMPGDGYRIDSEYPIGKEVADRTMWHALPKGRLSIECFTKAAAVFYVCACARHSYSHLE